MQESKPRKWIRKIHYNNPTLLSYNIVTSMNPELMKIHDSPIKYYSSKKNTQNLPNRSWKNISENTSKNILDEKFNRYRQIQMKRDRQQNRQYRLQDVDSYEKEQKRRVSYDRKQKQRKEKVWLHKSMVGQHQKGQRGVDLNYNDWESIRKKQLLGYNILSNM